MDFTAIQEFINPALLVLAVVLYFVGTGIKNSKTIKDEYIPFILMVIGIVVSAIYIFATSPITGSQDILLAIFESLTQGILCASAPVFVNQLIKQADKLN